MLSVKRGKYTFLQCLVSVPHNAMNKYISAISGKLDAFISVTYAYNKLESVSLHIKFFLIDHSVSIIKSKSTS